MKKPFSLKPIHDLAKHQSDDAAASLGRLKNTETRAKQTLETLLNYRDEYHARLQQALMNGISPGELNNFHAFLAKLDKAVEEQKKLLEQSQVRSASGLEQWQLKTRKVKSFDVLATRQRNQERMIDARQEQRALDDHTASRTFHKKHHG